MVSRLCWQKRELSAAAAVARWCCGNGVFFIRLSRRCESTESSRLIFALTIYRQEVRYLTDVTQKGVDFGKLEE